MVVLIAAPARLADNRIPGTTKEGIAFLPITPLSFPHTRKYLAINLGSNSFALLLPELTVNRGRYCHLPG
jgi:hypothetical protein